MRINADRLLVAALALLGTCVGSVVCADPPAAPAATSASAVSTSVAQSAAPAANAAAAAAAKPAITVNADAIQAAEEKQLLAAGYKPEMHNGVKMWCRKEDQLGSRLGGHKVCDTADRIKQITHDSQEQIELGQRKQINPSGH